MGAACDDVATDVSRLGSRHQPDNFHLIDFHLEHDQLDYDQFDHNHNDSRRGIDLIYRSAGQLWRWD